MGISHMSADDASRTRGLHGEGRLSEHEVSCQRMMLRAPAVSTAGGLT